MLGISVDPCSAFSSSSQPSRDSRPATLGRVHRTLSLSCPQQHEATWGLGRGGSAALETLLDLHPGFAKLGSTGQVAFLSVDPLNSYPLSQAGLLLDSSHSTHCCSVSFLGKRGAFGGQTLCWLPACKSWPGWAFPCTNRGPPGPRCTHLLPGRAHVGPQVHCVGVAGDGCLSFTPTQWWQRHWPQHSLQSPSSNPAGGT